VYRLRLNNIRTTASYFKAWQDKISLGASLKYPQPGDTQGEVLAICSVNQRVENRIVQRVPPCGIVGCSIIDVRVAGVDLLFRSSGVGAFVVRPQLESIAPIFTPTRATHTENQNKYQTIEMSWQSYCCLVPATTLCAGLRWQPHCHP
jgi:hypothetical protein